MGEVRYGLQAAGGMGDARPSPPPFHEEPDGGRVPPWCDSPLCFRWLPCPAKCQGHIISLTAPTIPLGETPGPSLFSAAHHPAEPTPGGGMREAR